jgi:hypothetical protein
MSHPLDGNRKPQAALDPTGTGTGIEIGAEVEVEIEIGVEAGQ